MDTRLKAKLETAIEKVIEDDCDNNYWQYMIHPELYSQMTNAAEQVFDAAQDIQAFVESENG